jgi:hypothetical protein
MFRTYQHAHHQKVETTHVANYTCYSTKLTDCGYDKNNLPHIHILSRDEGLLIRPKHVEVLYFNKLRINSASSWLLYT